VARRDEIEAQIAALQKELEGGDDDYEIEIRDGDKAARIPASRGQNWLKKNFPDLWEEIVGDDKDDDDAAKGTKTPAKSADGKVVPAHFRRRA